MHDRLINLLVKLRDGRTENGAEFAERAGDGVLLAYFGDRGIKCPALAQESFRVCSLAGVPVAPLNAGARDMCTSRRRILDRLGRCQ